MKIVMLSDFYPTIGGITTHVHTLSKELIKMGHEVFIITPFQEDLKDIDGIHVIGSKIIKIKGIVGLSFIISAKKTLESLLKTEDIDIIHGHMLYPFGVVAVDIGNKYNIPTYVTSHGVIKYNLRFIDIIFEKINKKVLDKADNVLAVSSDVLNKINNINIKNIKEKTFIHLNTVDINKFNEICYKMKEKPIIMFVGRLSKEKNIKSLLNAKKQSKTNYKLIIVGDGPEYKNLKNKVKKENIAGVTFTGFRNDIEKILPQADILILPSFSEGFGIVLIEALACGIPVIGSNVDGIKEIITPDVGLLIDPYNITTLTHAIDRILTDKKLYNKFKSNARKRAMQFSKMEIPYVELK